jgi:hypothetical protein
MPITASLGALTYSKSNVGDTNWYLQFENQLYLKSMDNVGTTLYLLADQSGGFPTSTSVLALSATGRPRINYEAQLIPPAFPSYSTTARATGSTQDNIILATGAIANFNIGDPIRFSGAVFGGVSAGVTYYVRGKPTANGISVSLTNGGAVVQLTTSTGLMTVSKYFGTLPPYIYGNSIKYNIANSKLYVVGNYYGYLSPSYYTNLGISSYVQTVDADTTNLNTNRNLSPNPTWVSNPYRDFLDIIPLNSTDTFEVGTTRVPRFSTTNAAANVRTIYSRINSSTLSYENYYQATTAGSDDPTYTGFTGLDSSGNVIAVWQYGGITINHGNAGQTTVIQKINPSTGTPSFTTRLYPGADVVTPVTDWPQYLMGATVNSSDNIIVINKEDTLIAPTNSRGGFVTCIGNVGPLFWQIHTSSFQPISVTTDASDNVYVLGEVYGTNNMVVAKFDDLGTLLWCNQLSNTSYDLRANKIKIEQGTMYITGNLIKTTLPYGFVMRLPSDGSIPGSGSYVINSTIAPFTLTYAAISPTITVGNTLVDYTAITMTASSSTIDSPTFITTNNIDPITTSVIN